MATKNFKDSEFDCNHCGLFIENTELKAVLELVRLKFKNRIVIVTSGTRCEIHNKNVGGKSKSKHLLGQAADIVVKGVNPQRVYDFLNETFPNYYGVGNYADFTHIDVRKDYWRG